MSKVFLQTKWTTYLGELRPIHDNYIYAFNQECVFSGSADYIAPTPSPTPTMTSTVTPTITPSITPTLTPSLTPSTTPSVTTTQTPSNTPTLTPSITPSITPTKTVTPTITSTVTPTVTQTQTPNLTPSITPTITPTISLTPSITPSITPTKTVTPSITPTITGTQGALCPQQVTITNISGDAGSTYDGTYDRIYTYTGGTLNYYYNEFAVKKYNVADPSGNYGIPYGKFDGTYYYSLFAQTATSPASIERYLVNRSTVGYMWDAPTPFDSYRVSGVELSGNLQLPLRGLNSGLGQVFYVSYPSSCPTPTPSVTPTITPSSTP